MAVLMYCTVEWIVDTVKDAHMNSVVHIKPGGRRICVLLTKDMAEGKERKNYY